jgi:signal transduction histidine kinase
MTAQHMSSPEASRPTADGSRDSDVSSGEVAVNPTPAYADFLARMAHDLRSPLGIVLETVGRLERELSNHFTDDHKLFLRLGNRGLLRLHAFVDRITLLAELEEGHLEPSKVELDLRDVVKSAVDATTRTEPRREVTVVNEPCDDACRVMGDPRLLTQAVQEIVRNAVAHARKAVRVAVESSNGIATVSVEDDGEGVRPGVEGTLFQRFVQRPSRSGLGIGLSIAMDVARAHGGGIERGQSSLPAGRPGTVGARFTLSLPAIAPRSA